MSPGHTKEGRYGHINVTWLHHFAVETVRQSSYWAARDQSRREVKLWPPYFGIVLE